MLCLVSVKSEEKNCKRKIKYEFKVNKLFFKIYFTYFPLAYKNKIVLKYINF